MSITSPQRQFLLMDEYGNPAVEFDSLLDIEINNGGKVLSVPVEQGSFATYNKVNESLMIRVTLATGVSSEEQRVVLATLQQLRQDTTLISLVTPQAEYPSMTLESYVVNRSQSEGSTMLIAKLSLVEVRTVATQTVKLKRSSVKRPQDASTENTGKAQPNPKGISLGKMLSNVWNGVR